MEKKYVETLFAEDAYKRSARNPHSKWPSPHNVTARLSPLCNVEHRPRFTFKFDSKFFTIGSCFARHIEFHLSKLGVHNLTTSEDDFKGDDVFENQALNRYTPISIRNTVLEAYEQSSDENIERSVVKCDNLYFDPFTRDSNLHDLQKIIRRRKMFRDVFSRVYDADVVIITLGQIEYWLDTETNLTFDNPIPDKVLLQHPKRFVARIATYDECRKNVLETIDLIQSHGRANSFLITTSPVAAKRTFRDLDSITSYVHTKSLLRTVSQEIVDNDTSVDYFPSYEVVSQSDRAAAFTDDLVHVRDSVVSNIMSKFILDYIEPPEGEMYAVNYALLAASNHISNGRMTEGYELLKPIYQAHPDHFELRNYFAYSAARTAHMDEAARALGIENGKDAGTTSAYNSGVAIINSAVAAANGHRKEEAAARILLLFDTPIISMLVEGDDMPLATITSLLKEFAHKWLLSLLTPSEIKDLLNTLYSKGKDVECRKLVNAAVDRKASNQTAEMRDLVEQCWSQYRGIIISEYSSDVRRILRAMFVDLKMTARISILDDIDEICSVNK